MKLENFKMTLEQFARFIETNPDLQEHWIDSRGCEGEINMDVKSYVIEYAGEKHGTRRDIMYWLLVEMNVIDPDLDTCDRLQKFIDNPT